MSQTVTLFKQLVPIANPSGREASIREFIQQKLRKMGFNDQHVDAAGNLLVKIPGDPTKETFLLSAHMDSVPPCEGIVPIEEMQAGRAVIRSEGKTILGADDKSGIAVILALCESLSASNSHHPLELLFSTQEEVGLLGLKAFDLSQCKATMGFVLDGEGHIGDVFNAGPSQKNLVFELTGLSSHAGIAPEAGISAITMATHLCAALPTGRLSPYTTMNIGLIEGGNAMNIVAPRATVKAEARSHDNALLESLLEEIRQTCQMVKKEFPGGHIELTALHKYSAFSVDKASPVVIKAIAAGKTVGLAPTVKPMNIGSDAHVLNHSGLTTVVLGMGFHFSHSLGEYIDVEELSNVTRWVQAIIQ